MADPVYRVVVGAARGMIAVMDRDQITAEVAARLVAGQFPQWAGLPVVPVGLNGWDNITFRLGGDLSIRLPSGQDYAAQVAKEHRWLPILAGQLPAPRAFVGRECRGIEPVPPELKTVRWHDIFSIIFGFALNPGSMLVGGMAVGVCRSGARSER